MLQKVLKNHTSTHEDSIQTKNGLQISDNILRVSLKSAGSRLSKVHNDIFFEDMKYKKNEETILND